MSRIHIAAPDGPLEPVLRVVRELGAEALLVLGSDPPIDPLEDVLGPMGIPVDLHEVRGPPILATVAAVEGILDDHAAPREALLVNLGGADRYASFGLLTAAFTTGLPAVRPTDGGTQQLPRLRFDCETRVGPEEWKVLACFERVQEADEEATLDRLAAVSDLSRVEISYRILGGDRCAGLEPMGLLASRQVDGAIHLELTPVGEAYLQCLPAERWLEPGPSGRQEDGRLEASIR